jgi:hypothetical protein
VAFLPRRLWQASLSYI